VTKLIFRKRSNVQDQSLHMNDDKTFTYAREPEGWAIGREKDIEETMSAEDAKKRWPQYAAEIDEALRGH